MTHVGNAQVAERLISWTIAYAGNTACSDITAEALGILFSSWHGFFFLLLKCYRTFKGRMGIHWLFIVFHLRLINSLFSLDSSFGCWLYLLLSQVKTYNVGFVLVDCSHGIGRAKQELFVTFSVDVRKVNVPFQHEDFQLYLTSIQVGCRTYSSCSCSAIHVMFTCIKLLSQSIRAECPVQSPTCRSIVIQH